jgi:hypothetical protein
VKFLKSRKKNPHNPSFDPITTISSRVKACLPFIRPSVPSPVPKNNRPSMVAYAYNPAYLGGEGRRILSLRTAQEKVVKPCLKIKKGLGCNSSGRTLAKYQEALCSILSTTKQQQ